MNKLLTATMILFLVLFLVGCGFSEHHYELIDEGILSEIEFGEVRVVVTFDDNNVYVLLSDYFYYSNPLQLGNYYYLYEHTSKTPFSRFYKLTETKDFWIGDGE